MLKNVTVDMMKDLLRKAHPAWDPSAAATLAEEYCRDLDSRLEPSILHFARTGGRMDFAMGEFSLLEICALRRNCPYIDAVILMDAYLKNPSRGRALILRR